ncbi:MAG: MarR family transcriptional regulator [Ruminococcaceae bacterium]|nr:MarR family transcriptional regulator [Oscillospiraceae bacterium]
MKNRYEQFSTVISGIYRCISKIERTEMEKLGYKGSYAQYLVTLLKNENGVTSTALGEICDKDKAAISRTVSEMEEAGLITRVSVSEASRNYRARLVLTEKGKKIADMVQKKSQEVVEDIGRSLSDYERTVVYDVLDRLYLNLKYISRKIKSDF